MKSLKSLTLSATTFLALLVGLQSQAQVRDLCNGPFRQEEVCSRMKHLRSTVNALDAQRELVQVNYDYLAVLGGNLKNNSAEILKVISMDRTEHIASLKVINQMGAALETDARAHQASALVKANQVRANCMSCHSKETPASGIKWNEIFKTDWEQISQTCNGPKKNPYLCKSMNGMLSAYSQVLTSYVAGMQDYAVTGAAANEVLRIIRDLGKNQVLHFSEPIRGEVEAKALEVVNLANAKDPMTFERSQSIAETCMECHRTNDAGPLGQLVKHSVWTR